VPIIPSASPISKYSTKPNSAILKITSKFVISCMVNSYFPTVIANWLAAAFRYRATPKTHILHMQHRMCVMSKADLHQRLDRAYEIRLSVKGRKSGRDIPRPVWFVHESNTLYFLPNYGSDTNWYKNLLADPALKISVNGVEIPVRGKPITDSNRVNDIFAKFESKYGEGDVKKYYPKVDVAVQVPL
jgi:hypothetical protein